MRPQQHESVLISPGKQTHVVVNPSIFYTSDDAVKSLKINERQCYEDREVRLDLNDGSIL